MWLLYEFLSLKNYVNVASKSNIQKQILVVVLKVTDEKSRIRSRIRTKMSRIRNHGRKNFQGDKWSPLALQSSCPLPSYLLRRPWRGDSTQKWRGGQTTFWRDGGEGNV